MLIHTLDERLPKSDNVTQGTHENRDGTQVEPSMINHIPTLLDLILEIMRL